VDPLPALSFLVIAILVTAVAVSPIPELSLALSLSGVGALIGQGVAAYRKSRDPHADPLQITFRWAASGFVFGWIIVVLDAVIA